MIEILLPFYPLLTSAILCKVHKRIGWLTKGDLCNMLLWQYAYFYHARVHIKCYHTHLPQVPYYSQIILKVRTWGTEITSMTHGTFEHIKGTENILADCISWLRSMGLYDVLDIEEGEKELGRNFISVNYPTSQPNMKGWEYICKSNTAYNQSIKLDWDKQATTSRSSWHLSSQRYAEIQ